MFKHTSLKLVQTTLDEVPTSHLTNLILNYIIKFEQPNKNDNNKHNPHTKLPALNRHNQNPNLTTVQMLMVLLQWLCGEVWEREFSYLWQQRICWHVCSLVHIYIMATNEVIVHYDQGFPITLCTCLTSHSFHINKPVTFLSLFHNSNNIWWQIQLMQLYIMQFSPISYYIQP